MQIGERVKDMINGFKGVVTARAEYLYGCVRLLVEPEALKNDGDIREAQWIDEQRLESFGMAPVCQGEHRQPLTSVGPGGPQKDAPRS